MQEIQERFKMVKQEYDKRHSKLLLQGKSQHLTSHGYWAASNPDQIFELFNKLKLGDYKHIADLGSGDGVVPAIASLFTQATGIEADHKLHSAAEELKTGMGLKTTLLNADYLDHNLSQYDFIFISPDNHFHKLESKLLKEFNGTLVLTENLFTPLILVPKKNLSVQGANFNIFKI